MKYNVTRMGTKEKIIISLSYHLWPIVAHQVWSCVRVVFHSDQHKDEEELQVDGLFKFN